jgi:PadR family transcriptional regulator PadR
VNPSAVPCKRVQMTHFSDSVVQMEHSVGRDTIGPFEFDVLRSLMELPEDAYGLTLRDRLQVQLERKVSLGAVYSTLERLETKGFISSWWSPGTPERGGRRKRLYCIEAAGHLAASRFASRFQGSALAHGGVS